MRTLYLNQRPLTRRRIFPRAWFRLGKAVGFIALCGFFAEANCGYGAETSLPETQVKSLFLLNFAKYVDWPADAFATPNAPIVIGLIGEGKLGTELAKTVESKVVSGRPILIRKIQAPEDADNCHILFIGASEKAVLGEILARLKALPVLTVGETEQFLEQGGMINFVKREGKIRLEISLDPARRANLQISSKLLGVADVVKGKSK